jgi:small nuclear ribonucleoprotein (snRNP)-like protein
LSAGLQNTSFKNLLIPLGAIRDSLGGPLLLTLKAYDELANSILKDRNEMKDLVDAMIHETAVDEYWNFFLEDAPENQLVKPDDYSYTRNFVHGPFWIALLLVKLGVPPPPLMVRCMTIPNLYYFKLLNFNYFFRSEIVPDVI